MQHIFNSLFPDRFPFAAVAVFDRISFLNLIVLFQLSAGEASEMIISLNISRLALLILGQEFFNISDFSPWTSDTLPSSFAIASLASV